MQEKSSKKHFYFKRQHFAFPYTLISIIFVIIPLLILVYYAFTNKYTGEFTFSNFDLFKKDSIWQTLWISFLMAFCTTIICLLICYPLALVLTKLKSNKTFIIVMIFVLPMWINSLLRIYSVKLLFGDYLHIEKGFLLSLIGMVYDFFPFMLLPIYTILANMPKHYFEASFDLGANSVKTFMKIKLPLSIPGIISGTTMVFMPALSTFAINDMLGSSQYWLFGNEIYKRLHDSGNYNVGSALSLVLLVLVIFSVLLSSALNNVINPNSKPSKNNGGIEK